MTWCITGSTTQPPSWITFAPPQPVRTNAMLADALRYRRMNTEIVATAMRTPRPISVTMIRPVVPMYSLGTSHGPTIKAAPTR